MPDEASCSGCPAGCDGHMTVKVVTVFEHNTTLPSHLATIGLYDPTTGACKAFMDGTYITAIRTSAAAAVATDLLARRDAQTLAIIGAGVQGEHHLRTFPLVRDFEEIRISSLYSADAHRLAALHPRAHAVDDPETAVARRGRGRARHPRRAARHRARLDRPRHPRLLGRLPPAGRRAARARCSTRRRCSWRPARRSSRRRSAARSCRAAPTAIVLGAARGRTTDDEITVYKAMGHVMEDIVAAELVYAQAIETGTGVTISL